MKDLREVRVIEVKLLFDAARDELRRLLIDFKTDDMGKPIEAPNSIVMLELGATWAINLLWDRLDEITAEIPEKWED